MCAPSLSGQQQQQQQPFLMYNRADTRETREDEPGIVNLRGGLYPSEIVLSGWLFDARNYDEDPRKGKNTRTPVFLISRIWHSLWLPLIIEFSEY